MCGPAGGGSWWSGCELLPGAQPATPGSLPNPQPLGRISLLPRQLCWSSHFRYSPHTSLLLLHSSSEAFFPLLLSFDKCCTGELFNSNKRITLPPQQGKMNILIIKQTGEGVNPPFAAPTSCALHPCSKRKPKPCPHEAGGADLGVRHTQQCLETPERAEEVVPPHVHMSACQGHCSVWYIVLDNHLLLKLAWESDKIPSGKGNPVGQALRERNSWSAL